MNTCYSGGAKGADEAWGVAAARHGHEVIHYSFNGHSPKHSNWKKELSSDELKAADPFVKRANKSMRRTFPTNSEFVNNLLRRNYYQIRETEALYAVGTIERGSVAGGTAWAVQMYIDVCTDRYEPAVIYFFDQPTNRWLMWVQDEWMEIEKPPIPSGKWTGIGSRELAANGAQAIKEVFIA